MCYSVNDKSGFQQEAFFVARWSLFPPYGGHYRRVEELVPCRVYAPETAVARMEGEVIGKQ